MDAFSKAPAKNAQEVPASSDEGDRLSSTNTAALREALIQTPEIRPEVVESGHRLVIDPNYPPREIIEGLARLLLQSQEIAEAE